ncbi:MAG: HAD-IA family hydrolase [Hyphomonas sp.]
MSLKLAIWDMDGTLVDSREIIHESMMQGFKACGLTPPTYDQSRRIVGLSLHEACARLAPEDVAPETIDALVAGYRQAFIAFRSRPGYVQPLYDGAMEILEQLRDENWLIAMATGKTRQGIRSVFASHPMEPFFDTIWCADDGPGKPHPFMVQQSMDALGVEAHQSLMIGDATFDILMGNAAGVKTLGVSWGFGTSDELAEAGADEIHETFESLSASLSSFTLN